MSRRGRLLAVLAITLAVIFEVALRTPELGAPLIRQLALSELAGANPAAGIRRLDRLVSAGDRAADNTLRGTALAVRGELDPAARDLLIGILNEDADDRATAYHALSGVHLLRAGVSGRPVTPPGQSEAHNAASAAGPGAAFLAAREALRLDPDNAAARWNLYLALMAGGGPPEPELTPPLENAGDRAAREFLRRSLRAVETSTISQSLPAILRELEARSPQPRRTGPPW